MTFILLNSRYWRRRLRTTCVNIVQFFPKFWRNSVRICETSWNSEMLAMSTLMMPAPTMAALGAPPLAVGPHKPPETKLLALHAPPPHPTATATHVHAPPQQTAQGKTGQIAFKELLRYDDINLVSKGCFLIHFRVTESSLIESFEKFKAR